MIYVDPLFKTPHHYKNENERWSHDQACHMFSPSEAELHQFAARIGLLPEWFQRNHINPRYWHYDLSPGQRQRAVNRGALEVTRAEMVAYLRGETINPAPRCDACRTPIMLCVNGIWSCFNCRLHDAIHLTRDDYERDRIYAIIDTHRKREAA